MVGSVLVVVSGYETIAGLHSMEVREAIEQMLAEDPLSGLGLEVGAVQQVVRVAAMLAAACATAAAILGYQVLRRNRAARLALTVLALPLFLAGMVTGGFFSSLVAICSVMLWLYPARAWFDGTWRPADASLGRGAGPAAPPWPTSPPAGGPTPPPAGPPGPPPTGAPTPPPAAAPTAGPRPVVGFGTAPPPDPTAYPPPAPWGGPVSQRRPAALVWAAMLTWSFAGFALVSTLAAVSVLAGDPGPVLDELHRQQPDLTAQGVSDDLVVRAAYVMAFLVALWSLAAIVLAVLAVVGVRWARVALLVCVGITSMMLVPMVLLGQLFLLVPLAAAVVTWVCLVRPEVRAWPPAPHGPMGP